MRIIFLLFFLALCLITVVWYSKAHASLVGKQAPDFTLPDEHGKLVTLSDLLKTNAYVVLLFYPRDDSFLCTKQLCQLRDMMPDIPKDIVLLGISSNSSAEHRAFKQKHNLPFPLLSDAQHTVHKLYGAYSWGLDARMTVIINKEGIIVASHSKMLSLTEHLNMIRSLIKT